MIQIFDIKKSKKNLKINNNEMLKKYINESRINSDDDFSRLDSKPSGLTKNEAKTRLDRDGKNIVIKDDKKSPLYFLLMSFKDEFIII